MGQVIPYSDALATFDRDRTAHDLKIKGYTERQIAERLQCSAEQVRAGIARMQGDIPPDWKRATIKADLERLDAMWVVHFERACQGDVMSTKLCLEMMERRAKFTGLDAPPTGSDIFSQALVADRSSSTERIRKIFELAARKDPSPNDDRPASERDTGGA